MKVGVIRGAKPAESAAEAGVKPKDLVAYEKMEDLLEFDAQAFVDGLVG